MFKLIPLLEVQSHRELLIYNVAYCQFEKETTKVKTCSNCYRAPTMNKELKLIEALEESPAKPQVDQISLLSLRSHF